MDEALDGPVETWTVRVDADTTPLEEQLKVATGLGRQFSSALINAFEGIAIKGRSLGDVLKSLALSLSNMVLKAAFRPLEQGFGNLLSGLFSGGFGFAKGAAFQQGLPMPFAKGGVINSPIAFPLARGRTGIAGERGAEAIMPLARGARWAPRCRVAGGRWDLCHVQRRDAGCRELPPLRDAGRGNAGARRRARAAQPLRADP